MIIAIKLKERGYVDMDISPDNFIIPTDIDDDADKVRWDEITDSKNAKIIKIDHESMIPWKEKTARVDKPMKAPFKAPEVNDENKEFDVEKANVYQFGATFI